MNDRTESLVAANCSPFMLSSADAIIVSSGSGRTSRLVAKYMPDIRDREPDIADIDDECESDIKKMCSVM